MNLIHNTLTFAKENGEVNIRIQLFSKKSKWILNYYDDGKGLPESFHFDPQKMFNRGDEESKGAVLGFSCAMKWLGPWMQNSNCLGQRSKSFMQLSKYLKEIYLNIK